MPSILMIAVAGLRSAWAAAELALTPSIRGRLVHKNRIFVVHHVNAGEQQDRQHDVHVGPAMAMEKTMPARMREKLRGSPVRSSMGFSPLILT